MRTPVLVLVGALVPLVPATLGLGRHAAPGPAQEGAKEMEAMMAKAKKYTQPGEHHELLRRFLGDWDTELRIFMGGQPTPPAKGTTTYSWLLEGRWLKSQSSGSVMGQPLQGFSILGYDNFKQSFVSTSVSTMDTAMNHAEGDFTQHRDALILYGTIDEYLTGEHDKMVKTVFRFVSDDEMVMEIHDLPIGEENTKVVEVRYARRK